MYHKIIKTEVIKLQTSQTKITSPIEDVTKNKILIDTSCHSVYGEGGTTKTLN